MKRVPFLSMLLLTLFAAACGGGDDEAVGSTEADRTVEIEMVDIAFKPDAIDVKRGETIRFVFRNTGKVAHDAFVGDADAQQEHENAMKEGEDDHGDHGGNADEAVTVKPGATEELTHTFEDPGAVEIGCHQPGHYGGGMKVTVNVA